ncbi:YggS family pyridoxal phosphate-dependent enzyme [Marinospirillum alkaliphilum]|uniref:Pyridoxal phosphate homeostasis protein n=1 Tax=Marinospirillum alkaliphilum DSM 21637 TaxID=1122209 RepID=A0A1K1WSQ2_9GAMM|nr:YggS family pyridoxal phosphate-dependent enzyme [Marinospirillum alkaliphilum]SFX40432.1 hypothetical protein SAMN02745752_01550 [Marinospirillum alkaliphilum DSM 21637]
MLHSVIAEHIAKVREQVGQACHKFGRNPAEVKILAVSKTQPAEVVAEAVAAGQTAFGENYLQEALQKQQALAHLPGLEWHFIGPVQSNKTRDIASHFDWLHTLDREKVAQRLNDQRPPGKAPLQVLIQVNVSGEATKSGVAPDAVQALASTVTQLPHLQLRGLMCIPEATEDVTVQRRAFAQMRRLLENLQQVLPEQPLDCLSMGMSGDLEAAIAEGSSLVRIGTAIFGARNPKALETTPDPGKTLNRIQGKP